MSYFNHFWQNPREPRAEHTKAWDRTKATAWDAKWDALSAAARLAYLTQIKGPTKEGSTTQGGTLLDKIPTEVVTELASAGFVEVEAGIGKRGSKIVALSAAHDFSLRLRAIHRYSLLGSSSNRENLEKYAKHAFFNQGETIVRRVLSKTGVDDYCRIDEALELYVSRKHWPEWALQSIESKVAGLLLEALRKAPGPVKMADLPGLVPSAKPDEVREALTDLIVHLVAFEDVRPGSFELIVGLFPSVREGLKSSGKPAKRPPLVVCENPKEVGPASGLEVNDLRVFLLEVASESPRLKQGGSIFQKEEARFLGALPPNPDWLNLILRTTTGHRLETAFDNAVGFGFTEAETDDKAHWLRLTEKGRAWLSSGIEDQYGEIYRQLRAVSKKSHDYSHYDSYGDVRFLGIPVSVHPLKDTKTRYLSYYSEINPQQRDALRKAIFESLDALPVGVYHRWDGVIEHLTFDGKSPLTLGNEPSKLAIFVGQQQIPRLSQHLAKATNLVLSSFLLNQLIPFDAFRPAIDDEGKLCVARLPRFNGYFGRPYKVDPDEASASTRVIVQPDFSVVVIGLDPAPAAELAPFCDRAGGHAGQGILTFKITRSSVIRAASQGLLGPSIIARLKKHASVDVPENVLREIQEWAGWVRLVNVKPIMVVRCPDKETVARVVSVLGKKAERLSDSLVALHIPKLSSAERQKLQEQGILITKNEIVVATEPRSSPESKPSPARKATASGKKGRPKKAR